MDLGLTGKRVAIAGGGKGIGLAVEEGVDTFSSRP